jgi:rare lipoprotein A
MQTDTACRTRTRHRSFTAAALVLLVTVSAATAQTTPSSHVHSNRPHKASKWTQTGKASWYGRKFQGRKTASGEAFDLNMLTCAHRTLPIGTLLRVTNLGNRRSIMVRVNDRGPVPEGLIVDLSYAAARSLGFTRAGRAHVRLERVDGAERAQLNWPDLGRPADPAASR